MSSGEVTTIALPSSASITLKLPEGAAREAESALPRIEVGNLPGAWIAAREGWTRGPLALRAICAAAPPNGWAPGVEDLVLARATQIAHGALGGVVTRFEAAAITTEGPRFVQGFTGAVDREGTTLAVRGKHVLGFAGEPRVAILCTIGCAEPASDHACETLVTAASASGTWREAPPPNALVRSILLAADRPHAALAIAGAGALALAALVIAKRPRPRP
jgi:hypothetical protein